MTAGGDASPGAPVPVAVGIDVGGTKTAVALVAADGRVVTERVLATKADEGAEQLHDRLVHAVRELRDHDAARGHRVPLGIVLPELVSPGGEVLTEVVVPGIAGPLAQRWGDLDVTVVDADVRAGAVAESELGHGRGLDSFVYVSVGTGISTCFVVAGRPWAGHRGAALLLGSGLLVATPSGPSSEQPGSGPAGPPLEELAGGPALLAAYRSAGGRAESTELLLARAGDDPLAARVVTAGGHLLGLGLAEVVNLLDPQAVVVGGGLGSAPGRYWEAAVAAARPAIWAEVSRRLPLLQAATGARAGVLGAALLAMRTHVSRP